MIVGSVLQVFIAIVLVVILFVIGFTIYNMELVKAYTDANKIKKEVQIIKGIIDLNTTKASYVTNDPMDPNYLELDTSVNQEGGAEYTYNFWLFMKENVFTAIPGPLSIETPDRGFGGPESLEEKYKSMVLLLRGNKMIKPYNGICGKNVKLDVMVKSPMIRLERNGRVLAVDINTLAHPDGVREKARNTCSETNTNWGFINSYRLAVDNLNSDELKNKWFMVTVTVQDTFPTDPLPLRNKVRVRIFINGNLELDRYVDGRLAESGLVPTVLKQNRANLHVNPDITYTPPSVIGSPTPPTTTTKSVNFATAAGMIRMADLSYMNYALSSEEVISRFEAGFSNQEGKVTVSNPKTKPLNSSEPLSLRADDPVLKELSGL